MFPVEHSRNTAMTRLREAGTGRDASSRNAGASSASYRAASLVQISNFPCGFRNFASPTAVPRSPTARTVAES